MKRLLLWAALPLLLLSCTEKIHDPGKDDKGPVEGEMVAVQGFYTLEHEGFKFKIREEEYNTPAAQSAIALLKENFEEINKLLPKYALDVMHRNPIWMERDLTDGAAWYHTSKEWLESQGYMTEKWHCVELCNFVHYVSWTKQNQPYMVLHELCHLYHDLALPGGFENPDVKAAYNHAMAEGLYVNTAYRLDKNDQPDGVFLRDLRSILGRERLLPLQLRGPQGLRSAGFRPDGEGLGKTRQVIPYSINP